MDVLSPLNKNISDISLLEYFLHTIQVWCKSQIWSRPLQIDLARFDSEISL